MTPLWLRAALVAGLALVAFPACGDADGFAGGLDESDGIRALVTLAIPADPGTGWDLPDPGVIVVRRDDRTGLLIALGDEPTVITVPMPAKAEGAGHVSLRIMSDGAFVMQLEVGGQQTGAIKISETRRRWKEVTFSLSAPLSGAALTDPLKIIRVSGEQPLVIEAIRFLP